MEQWIYRNIAAILITAWAIAFSAALFSGCYGAHEDVGLQPTAAGSGSCPEGWVRGNEAQPGDCLRIAPGSPADIGVTSQALEQGVFTYRNSNGGGALSDTNKKKRALRCLVMSMRPNVANAWSCSGSGSSGAPTCTGWDGHDPGVYFVADSGCVRVGPTVNNNWACQLLVKWTDVAGNNYFHYGSYQTGNSGASYTFDNGLQGSCTWSPSRMEVYAP